MPCNSKPSAVYDTMNNFLAEDEILTRRCFELAKKAQGRTSPNPLVGCVIARHGEVLVEAWHERAKTPHAEALAIAKLRPCENVKDMTLYGNLEPCCHTNKHTPPCLPLVLQTGIKRVVISNLDPNPQVAGKSIKLLRSHGIEVVVGVLEEEGRELNKTYFKWMSSGLPYVHLKWAQTLDGRMASHTGNSQWISNEKGRTEAHFLRFVYDAVLVGRKTVDADNPSLNVRMVKGVEKMPWRIVVGLPRQASTAKVFCDGHQHKTLLAIPQNVEVPKCILDKNVPIWRCLSTKAGKISMPALLEELGRRKITSVLVEGGSTIHTTFFEEGLWDEYTGYIAPCLMGNGPGPFKSSLRNSVNQALALPNPRFRTLDDQVVIEGRRAFCLPD